MKRLSFLFFFIFCCGIAKVYSQPSDIIYIRIQEDIGEERCESLMTIAYPNQKTEEIPLVEIGLKGVEAKSNTLTIRNKLNQLTNEGYTIQSSSVAANAKMSITIIILSRSIKPKTAD